MSRHRGFPFVAISALAFLIASATPALAESYSEGFVGYWTKALRKTDNVVLFSLGIGAVCITVILFSGKWKK